ncbi:class I SAM-dependent methyltransferase [Streptomyces sp. NPDC048258]|uniref:class I SAM-dependent methyltransferase n=1 Tax=Streptomyces sp. NPDC048258 TaxID=3365527 RepID=UPI0037198219
MTLSAEAWHRHYEAGKDFRPMTGAVRAVLDEHLRLQADAEGRRALDVACGTGELARLLAEAGYRVDAVDYARAAIDRAREVSPPEIAFHCLDIADGDLTALTPADGYALITVCRALAHLPDRTRVVAALGALLGPDGTLCVITPHAARMPEDLRSICLDDAELDTLADGWERSERVDAAESTVVLLHGPCTTVTDARNPPSVALENP